MAVGVILGARLAASFWDQDGEMLCWHVLLLSLHARHTTPHLAHHPDFPSL